MPPLKFNEEFATVYDAAAGLSKSSGAHAVLLLLEGPTDWHQLKQRSVGQPVIVAADTPEQLAGAAAAGLMTVVLDMPESPVYDKLSQALLEAVAD